MQPTSELPLPAVRRAAEDTPGLTLLILFGSQAQDRAHGGSDWDFGYLAAKDAPVDHLHAKLIAALNTERVDLVNLATASGLLRYRAASQGRPLYEAQGGEFARFWMEAVDFWCDVQAILRTGYDRILERLGP